MFFKKKQNSLINISEKYLNFPKDKIYKYILKDAPIDLREYIKNNFFISNLFMLIYKKNTYEYLEMKDKSYCEDKILFGLYPDLDSVKYVSDKILNEQENPENYVKWLTTLTVVHKKVIENKQTSLEPFRIKLVGKKNLGDMRVNDVMIVFPKIDENDEILTDDIMLKTFFNIFSKFPYETKEISVVEMDFLYLNTYNDVTNINVLETLGLNI